MTPDPPAERQLIVVLGDSLSMPRAEAGVDAWDLYPHLIAAAKRRAGLQVEVWNLAEGGAPLKQLARRYAHVADRSGRPVGEVAILQAGVVDCPLRPIPIRLRNAIGRAPAPLRKRAVAFIHRHRRRLIKAMPDLSYTRPRAFAELYGQLLHRMGSDFSRVYAINICPAGEYFRDRSPGIDERIVRYNELIRQAVQNVPNAKLIDVHADFGTGDSPCMSAADGHHLTRQGHARIAELIVEHEPQPETHKRRAERLATT